jgi:hypothetical protein
MSYRAFDSIVLDTANALASVNNSDLLAAFYRLREFLQREDCSGGVITALESLTHSQPYPPNIEYDLAHAILVIIKNLVVIKAHDLTIQWLGLVGMEIYVRMSVKERRAFRKSKSLSDLIKLYHQNLFNTTPHAENIPDASDFANEFSAWDWLDDCEVTNIDIKFLTSWYSPILTQIKKNDSLRYETLCLQYRIEEMRSLLEHFPKSSVISEWLAYEPEMLSEEQKVTLSACDYLYRSFRKSLNQARNNISTLKKIVPDQTEIVKISETIKQISSVQTHMIEKQDIDELLASQWFCHYTQ